MVFGELFYKHCRGCLWSIVKGHWTAVEHFMDAAEECKKTEVIAIIVLKIEKRYRRGLWCKINPAYTPSILSACSLFLKYSI